MFSWPRGVCVKRQPSIAGERGVRDSCRGLGSCKLGDTTQTPRYTGIQWLGTAQAGPSLSLLYLPWGHLCSLLLFDRVPGTNKRHAVPLPLRRDRRRPTPTRQHVHP